jgi:hypothetical protein
LSGQFGIEVAARIVGDAGRMDDRVAAPQVERIDIAHIALDRRKIRVVGQKIAEPHDIERGNLAIALQQFWNQPRTLVSARAGDQNFHRVTMKNSDYSGSQSGRRSAEVTPDRDHRDGIVIYGWPRVRKWF